MNKANCRYRDELNHVCHGPFGPDDAVRPGADCAAEARAQVAELVEDDMREAAAEAAFEATQWNKDRMKGTLGASISKSR